VSAAHRDTHEMNGLRAEMRAEMRAEIARLDDRLTVALDLRERVVAIEAKLQR